MTTDNPLKKYFRQPDLYITLPSKGQWWPKDSLNLPPNNEVAICSMTGADDLALRNADGLMNGDTTIRVIESCCPNIKNAWDMPNIDLDALFIAIRIASYGNQMDSSTRCSKCNEFIEYAIDLQIILNDIKIPDFSTPIFAGDLTIYLKPPSFKIHNLNSQEIFQQQKTLIALKSSNLDETAKTKIVKEALTKLTEITVLRMHEFIEKIVLPTGETVDAYDFIKDFIENADRQTFSIISDAVKEKNTQYQLPKIPIKCDSCGHSDERELVFDPSNFFVSNS